MFAGFNIKEDYLSDEDKNSSQLNQTSDTLSVDNNTLPTIESPQDSLENVVAINNITTTQDEDSFILITKTNTAQEIQNIAIAELPTQENNFSESNQSNESYQQNASMFETPVSSIAKEEIEFHAIEQSDQNVQPFENMERSFMAHETSVSSPLERLSILTEEIDTDDSTTSSSCSPLLPQEDQIETQEFENSVEETKQVQDESSTPTNSKSPEETILGSMFSKEDDHYIKGLLNFWEIINPSSPKFNFFWHTGTIACLSLIVMGLSDIFYCK